MWNYAHNSRSTAGYTSEKPSRWICSRITKDRFRRSGHGNTSPIPKIATCLSKHILLIKSGMSWRKRLILVDIIMQAETLSTHNWINKSWTCSSSSSAWTHTPQISFSAFLETHTHFLLRWRTEAPLLPRERRIPSLIALPLQKPTRLPCATPAALPKPPGGSGAGLAPPGFPPWAWGSNELEIAGQNPARTTECYLVWLHGQFKPYETASWVRFWYQLINQPRFIWKWI